MAEQHENITELDELLEGRAAEPDPPASDERAAQLALMRAMRMPVAQPSARHRVEP